MLDVHLRRLHLHKNTSSKLAQMRVGEQSKMFSVGVTKTGHWVGHPQSRIVVYNCPKWVLPEHRWYYPHCFMTREQAYEEWAEQWKEPA